MKVTFKTNYDSGTPLLHIWIKRRFRKPRHYVCQRVGIFSADWIDMDKGGLVSMDSRLYNLLNDLGRRWQVEGMKDSTFTA